MSSTAKTVKKRQREGVRQAHRALEQIAHRMWQARRRRETAQETAQQFEANNQGMERVSYSLFAAFFLIGFLPIGAALFLDFLLLAAPAEYLISLGFTQEAVARLGQFIVPLAIMALELGVAAQIHLAREKVEEFSAAPRPADKLPLWGWKLFGLLMAIVIPSMAVATFIQQEFVEGTTLADMDMPKLLLLVGVASLAVACHAVVIYGGSRAHRARAYILYRLSLWYKQGKVRRTSARFDRQGAGLATAFETYMKLFGEYNDQYQDDQLQAGPFDGPTRTVVNEHYAYEIIAAPQGPPQPPPAPQGPPEPPPATPPGYGDGAAAGPEPVIVPPDVPRSGLDEPEDADGDNPEIDYYRTILASQQRAADSEITS